ncbi:PFL_4669 family integrating conjugative element protein [Salinisphaera orenii]|uniref:PFL_4669 family integrating conjugative element protein n=1 Tax=Salinisphaera orenii TaxID=856731 RepID=UPI000DBE2798
MPSQGAAQAMTQPESPKPPSRDAIKPGRLENHVEMTIQTRHAQRLVQGRRGNKEKPPIIGLLRFGSEIKLIWTGAVRDDPYADWWLLHIENTLTESREAIDAMRQSVDQQLDRVSAMNVGIAESSAPNKVDLAFKTPYAFMGAWHLIDFDELVLRIMTARHVGLMTRDESGRKLAEAGRAIRHTFDSVQGYRFTNVKRDDVRQNTRRGQRAIERFGDLPQSILAGDLRAEHAPEIGATEDDSARQAEAVEPDADADDDSEDT